MIYEDVCVQRTDGDPTLTRVTGFTVRFTGFAVIALSMLYRMNLNFLYNGVNAIGIMHTENKQLRAGVCK